MKYPMVFTTPLKQGNRSHWKIRISYGCDGAREQEKGIRDIRDVRGIREQKQDILRIEVVTVVFNNETLDRCLRIEVVNWKRRNDIQRDFIINKEQVIIGKTLKKMEGAWFISRGRTKKNDLLFAGDREQYKI